VQIDQWIATELEEHELTRPIRLETTLHSHATVLIDGARFRQVFINLLQNAEQAIVLRHNVNSYRGELTITTWVSDGQLELRITDNGMGIRSENRDKLFKPLFSTKVYGVGLGLPLVKRVVEQHNGRINVASQWGQGTTITIWLPLASPMTDNEHQPSVQTPQRSSVTELDERCGHLTDGRPWIDRSRRTH
jgi:signal transduction histidine kinase